MAGQSSLTRFCMACGLVMIFTALAGTTGSAQTSADSKKTPPKKAPAKDNTQAEERLETVILARLKQQFAKQDINRSGGLEKAELITWLGLVNGPEMLKKYDQDSDGKVSPEEFEAWATEYAAASAKEMVEQQQQAEAELERLQKAYAKASAQAKAQYQKALQRQREQVQRLRDRRDADRRRQQRRR